jgi:hypothetical protein
MRMLTMDSRVPIDATSASAETLGVHGKASMRFRDSGVVSQVRGGMRAVDTSLCLASSVLARLFQCERMIVDEG